MYRVLRDIRESMRIVCVPSKGFNYKNKTSRATLEKTQHFVAGKNLVSNSFKYSRELEAGVFGKGSNRNEN